jgi:hypothetical protein
MNDLDNLIIAAFRDKNFKFAVEAPDVDPEASALAILNERFNAALKAKNYDEPLVSKIYEIIGNARTFLNKRLSRDIGAAISYERSTGIFSLIDTGDPQVNQFYQVLINKVLDRLGESASPASTSPSSLTSPETSPETTSTTSEPIEREFKRTKLLFSIQTGTQAPKNYTILNAISIGSRPSEAGITIEDINAAANHIYFLNDLYGTWKVMPIQAKDTYFNGEPIEPDYSELAENDMIYFSNTRVKILKIEDATEAESPSS